MTDTIDKLTIQATTQGVQQSTTELNQLGKAMSGVSVESQNIERSTVSVEGKFASLERRYSTVAGNAQQLAKIQDTVNKAVAQNPELQDRANAVMAAATARYGEVAGAEDKLTKSHGGLDASSQALMHSFRGFAEQVALGISPMQAFTSEMNRLSFVATSEGGISGALGKVTNVLGGMFTATRVALGGAAGLAAAGLYLANSWQKAGEEVDLALTGIGERTGTTATDIANFTKANSSATGLSVSEARNAAIEFTKTGDIQIASLHGVGEAIKGYSTLTGTNATEATKAFANAVSGDVVKGITTLNQRYGVLDATTLDYIRSLDVAGQKTQALQIFINASADANKRAEGSVGSLTKAWQAFKNVISDVTNGPAPVSLDDQLAAAQKNLAAAQNGTQRNSRGEFVDTSGLVGGTSAAQKAVDDLQKKVNDFRADQFVAQLKEVSSAADADVRAILPQLDALDKLNKAMNEIKFAQADGAIGLKQANDALAVYQYQANLQKESLDTTVRQAQAVNDLQTKYQGVSTQTALTLNSLNSQLQVAQALTGLAQMKAQSEATYVDLIAKGTKEEEASAIAAKQLAVAKAAATTAVEKQVESLKDSTRMIKAQQDGTEATTAAAIAYKNAIASGASETAAAALKAETLKNYLAQGAASAQQMANAYIGMLEVAGQKTTYNTLGVPYAPNYTGQSLSMAASLNGNAFGSYNTSTSAYSGSTTNFASLSVDDQLALIQSGMFRPTDNYSGYPDIKFPGSKTDTATTALTSSINKLTTSTDNLNATNQEMLSPYYTTDPRTSHIGFRSQGMATGGYVDVPGGISANDNMLAMIPVASGERISVDPMSAKRGVGATQVNNSITINVPVTIVGNQSKDDIGRTVYQAAQAATRQLAAAQK